MTRITLDAALSSQLCELGEAAELCDPAGRVLGRFVPALDPAQWEAVTPEATQAELERREQSTEWYTTQEVLTRLSRLEQT
jgi:hypothetical protein